jgi:hypothetical protein
VYIWKGKVSVTDVAHVEFQRELNASLIGRIAEMDDYIEKVRGIVDVVRTGNPNYYTDNFGYPGSAGGMRRLIEIGPPRRLEIDAVRYILQNDSRNGVSTC